jgi:hypothetical protein
MLHCRLCIVGGLFVRTIVNQVGKLKAAYKKAGLNKAGEYDPAALVVAELSRCGMEMKASKIKDQTAQKLDKANMDFKSFSFVGRDSEILTLAHLALLAIVYPASLTGPWISDDVLFGTEPEHATARFDAEVKAKDREACRQLMRARIVWRRWIELWVVWSSDLAPGSTWDERADDVHALAKVFLARHTDACGTTRGLYLHVLHAHVPGQIRRFHDMRHRQAQGHEHNHKLMKMIGVLCSNRKPGERLRTILTHVHVLERLLRDEADVTSAKHEHAKITVIRRCQSKMKRILETMPDDDFTAMTMYPLGQIIVEAAESAMQAQKAFRDCQIATASTAAAAATVWRLCHA